MEETMHNVLISFFCDKFINGLYTDTIDKYKHVIETFQTILQSSDKYFATLTKDIYQFYICKNNRYENIAYNSFINEIVKSFSMDQLSADTQLKFLRFICIDLVTELRIVINSDPELVNKIISHRELLNKDDITKLRDVCQQKITDISNLVFAKKYNKKIIKIPRDELIKLRDDLIKLRDEVNSLKVENEQLKRKLDMSTTVETVTVNTSTE